MRRSVATPRRRQVRHTLSRQALTRSARGGLLLFLAGALVALAGTPANLQEALQAQRALVAENPTDADLLNDLGNLLALAGDFAEAEEVYHRALGIDSGDITALYNLALVQMEQGRTKEANKTLTSILESDPRHAWTHYQLGSLYADKRNRAKAVHHYAEAFSIDRSLTSPEVNPHIVENQLATEALLKMYVDKSPSTQAPRIYEEPGDVAELLLPQESAVPAEEPVTETVPEIVTEPVPRRHRASYPAPAASDDSEESADSSPSLDDPSASDARQREEELSEPTVQPGDLSDAESGQAVPRRIDDSDLRTQQSGQSESRTDTSTSQGGIAQSPSGNVTRSSSPGEPTPSGDLSTSGGDPISSPSSFVPGVQSTGRLDIELLPAAEPAPATSPT